MSDAQAENTGGERIAKFIAHAGVCSRRDAEKLIAEGRVKVDGKLLDTPAFKVTAANHVVVDGRPIKRKTTSRLWLYHKPTGLVTSHKDEKGRSTVFDHLPKKLPRVVSVGRLDLNSEGLLLLTNDGELAGKLSHPSLGWKRTYRVRIYGKPTDAELDELRAGATVDGFTFAPAEIELESQKGRNCWYKVTLTEGKNREIRRMFEHIDCPVSRLIRTSFGPFHLGQLMVGTVSEVKNPIENFSL